MDQVVTVSPVDGGWKVMCSITGQPLMFSSGAKAEEKARSLAEVFANSGQDARVVVHDRRNTLIGTVRYFASL